MVGHRTFIDIDCMVGESTLRWTNFTPSEVNDSLARLGIFEGEFHWHHCDMEDELFFVLSGRLLLDSGRAQ